MNRLEDCPKKREGLWIGLAFLFMFSNVPVAWAGAWTVPRNHWYAEYFYRYFGSKHEFDSEGSSNRRPKAATFRDIRNEWKLEYGVTDWLNLLASVPYISSHFRDDGVDLLRTGAGDIHVRTKLRALNKALLADEEPLVGSLQFSWKIPSAYDPKENPIGDGQVDFESRVQLSQSWVYRPYEVRVPTRRRQQSQTGKRARHAPHAAKSREEAIREAVLVAELYQQGMRLAHEGRDTEATKWLRAVLESQPEHYEAFRWLLNHAMAVAEGSTRSAPRLVTVSDETFEPVEPLLQGWSETETRYAGVAFVTLEGGFTARNEDPANEFPIFLEAGFTPFKRLMLVGSLDSVISVKSTSEQTEDFAKWGVRAIVNIWGDGFASVFRETAGPTVNFEVGYNDIFAGRNTADAFEIFGKVGIFF